jgi:hypothetical protein
MKTREQVFAEARENIEAGRAITGAPRVVIPDALTQYRADQQAFIDADEAEKQRREAVRVRAWVQKSMTEPGDAAPAATSVEATCGLVADIVGPVFANMQRQIAELRQELATTNAKYEAASAKYEAASARIDVLQAHINILSAPTANALSSHSSKAH